MEPESYSMELMEELDSAIQAYLDRYPKLAALEVEISYRTADGKESFSVKSSDLKSSDR